MKTPHRNLGTAPRAAVMASGGRGRSAGGLALTMVAAAALAISGPMAAMASTIELKPGGSLNGQAIGPDQHGITVQPGAPIDGTINIVVNNTSPSGHVYPVGATPTWGDRRTSFWTISAWSFAGSRAYAVAINLLAPTAPGHYLIAFAGAEECRTDQVMSATGWQTNGRDTVCSQAQTPAIWGDGNDVGWDWTAAQLAQARRDGQVTHKVKRWTGDAPDYTVSGNWIGVTVVPEPGTWTMGLFGVAAVVLVSNRLRRRSPHDARASGHPVRR